MNKKLKEQLEIVIIQCSALKAKLDEALARNRQYEIEINELHAELKQAQAASDRDVPMPDATAAPKPTTDAQDEQQASENLEETNEEAVAAAKPTDVPDEAQASKILEETNTEAVAAPKPTDVPDEAQASKILEETKAEAIAPAKPTDAQDEQQASENLEEMNTEAVAAPSAAEASEPQAEDETTVSQPASESAHVEQSAPVADGALPENIAEPQEAVFEAEEILPENISEPIAAAPEAGESLPESIAEPQEAVLEIEEVLPESIDEPKAAAPGEPNQSQLFQSILEAGAVMVSKAVSLSKEYITRLESQHPEGCNSLVDIIRSRADLFKVEISGIIAGFGTTTEKQEKMHTALVKLIQYFENVK